MDLLDLLGRPEGKTLEFKRDLSSPERVLRTLVAFANTAGGVVLIGVENTTRHVRGVADPLAVEERLANLISDHTLTNCSKKGAKTFCALLPSTAPATFASLGPPLAERRMSVARLTSLWRWNRADLCWTWEGSGTSLESLLGWRVEVVTPRGLKARIRDRVLQEAVPL